MPLFIKFFFWILVQHSMGMKGGDEKPGGGAFSSFASFAMPVVYDQVAFTVRGEEHIVGSACMEQGYFMGVTAKQELEPGVFRVQVNYKALPAARLSNIVARISSQAEIVQVETH